MSVAVLLGSLVGGAVGIAILAAIIEFLAFKSLEPTRRAQYTVGLALILAAILSGFGLSNGEGFAWTAGWIYLPGAALVYFWYLKRYERAWVQDDG